MVWGLGFRVKGLEFRAYCEGLKVQDLGFWVGSLEFGKSLCFALGSEFVWLRVWALGFSVWDLGFRVWGSGFGVEGSRFRVQGSGFRVQGSGVRVQGSGFRVCLAPQEPVGGVFGGERGLSALGLTVCGSGCRVQGLPGPT